MKTVAIGNRLRRDITRSVMSTLLTRCCHGLVCALGWCRCRFTRRHPAIRQKYESIACVDAAAAAIIIRRLDLQLGDVVDLVLHFGKAGNLQADVIGSRQKVQKIDLEVDAAAPLAASGTSWFVNQVLASVISTPRFE